MTDDYEGLGEDTYLVNEAYITERKPKRKLLEKDIQKQCVAWARSRGWWARKLSSPANRSVPDYLFSKLGKIKVAVEFKAPGKTSTEAQLDEQNAMCAAGWTVWEINNVEKFKEFMLTLESVTRATM